MKMLKTVKGCGVTNGFISIYEKSMPFGIKIWWVDFHLWQGVPISEILSSMD
jgi:hypothetical protein